jgi:hypothetical protein
MEVPHVFEAGKVISSSEMNANFTAIENRIDEIETGTAVWNKDELTGNLRYMDGNIGIGVENPLNPLEVAGNVDAAGFTIAGIPLSTSTGTYWSESSGNVYYNSGNVGMYCFSGNRYKT